MAAEVRIVISSTASGSAASGVKGEIQDIGETAKTAGGGFNIFKEVATGALREIGSLAAGAAVEGLKAVAGAIGDGITDAREAAKIMAQTEAVIKSTGGAAGVTAQQVADYASSLSAASGASLFGDDQIQQSENLLLTFSEIKGHALEAATAISVDMAQALGGAPKDSAIQLGKALNDPISGVTALTRVGVSFTEEQKAQIKTLQESGDMMGAQQVILGELNKEFGGSAAAAAQADGGWAQFNDRMGEAKESIGAAILPLLGQLSGFLNDTIAPAIETAATAFSAWLNDPETQANLQTITTAIKGGLGTAFTFLTETAIPALKSAWTDLQPAITLVSGFFNQAGDSAGGFGGALTELGHVWDTIKSTIDTIVPPIKEVVMGVFGTIQTFLNTHGEDIKAFLGETWAQIKDIIDTAAELIKAIVVPIFQSIASFLSEHSDTIQAVLSAGWEIIKAVIRTALAIVKGVIQTALALIKGDWSGAWEAIKTMVSTVWENIKIIFSKQLEIIKTILTDVWDKVKSIFGDALAKIVAGVKLEFENIIGAIRSFVGKIASAAASVGDGIIGGIVDGIKNGASAIVNAARDAALSALNAAKHALGISSPSLVFAESVGLPMAQGMALGLAGGAPLVAQAGQYAADAAVAGGRAATYNQQRTVTYSPTYNNVANPPSMDSAIIQSLAGV